MFPSFAPLALAAALAAGTASAAVVGPNPLSLLKGKRVLVALPTYATDYHPGPRNIVNGKIEKIKTAHGIATVTFLKGIDTMSLATMNQYDIMVFNYFTKMELVEKAPFGIAFRKWLEAGNRGWVGNHNTGSQSAGEWNWWRDSVQSMRYIDHKDQSQRGTIKVTTDASMKNHPVLAGLDPQFTGDDEWYSFDLPPKAPAPPTWADCKPLYYLDESSVAQLTDKMGANHPVAWIREDGRKNRYFCTNLIHSDNGANSDFYHSLLMRGMEYVAGYQPDPTGILRPLADTRSAGAGDAGPVEFFRADGRHILTIRGLDGRDGKRRPARGISFGGNP